MSDANLAIFPAAPTAELVPNVLLCIPLDSTSETEIRDSDDWATQDLLTLYPDLLTVLRDRRLQMVQSKSFGHYTGYVKQ